MVFWSFSPLLTVDDSVVKDLHGLRTGPCLLCNISLILGIRQSQSDPENVNHGGANNTLVHICTWPLVLDLLLSSHLHVSSAYRHVDVWLGMPCQGLLSG